MISYRDKTFCSASPTACGNTECHRYFGPEQQADADEWWKGFNSGHGAPVSFADFSKDCPDIMPPSLTDETN